MSLKTLTAYTVVCDGCGESADEGTDWSCWLDETGAVDSASNAEFLSTDDGKHYCLDCTEWDEATDERVPRKPAVIPGST